MKKFLSLLVALSLVLSLMPAALAIDDPEEEIKVQVFEDIGEDHVFATEIEWAYHNWYVKGVGEKTYDAISPVSRQQLWMVLGRHATVDPENMAEAKAWAMELGLTDGSNPGAAVSRQQMVATLCRYAQLVGYDTSAKADLSSYLDAADVADYAADAMAWAVASGIINGTTAGTLNPAGNTTRGAFAAILYRFCNLGESDVEEEAPETPETPSTPSTPPHSHEYTYTPNNDGTHSMICACGTTTEDCTIVDGVCERCGYIEYYVLDGSEVDYMQNTEFQRAIKDLPAGSTVVLRNGDFRVAFLPEYSVPANLTVIGEDTALVKEFGLEVDVEGLALKDLTFEGILYGVAREAGVTVEGLTIDGCTAKAIHLGNATGCSLVDVTVQDCVLTGPETGFNGITLNNVSGTTTVAGNTVTDAADIGIALLGTVAGEVTVEGNTINDTGDRVFRFNAIEDNANVNIFGNTVISSGDNGQMIKYTTLGTNAAVTLDNNTWNGYDDEELGYNNGVWSLPVVVSTTSELELALHKSAAGSTILLKEGVDYGEVYVGNGYGVTEVPANLTIVGAAGASVDLTIRSGFKVIGWTFDGVTFSGEGLEFCNGASADDLAITNCVFGEGTMIYVLKNDGGYIKGGIISGCDFSGNRNSAIIIQDAENVEISECSFENAGHNAIQMTQTKGSIVISDNTVNGTTDRVFRFNNTSATITVSGNTVISNGDNGQVMKVDGTVDTTKIIRTNNTWNGYADDELSYAGGIWTLPNLE